MAEGARPARPSRGSSGSRSGVGGLVGAGPSIVGVSGSMRARDVSRPTEVDEEIAERDTVIRRRPPAPPEQARPTSP